MYTYTEMELLEKVIDGYEWDADAMAELCDRAGLADEWEAANRGGGLADIWEGSSLDFESVIYSAQKIIELEEAAYSRKKGGGTLAKFGQYIAHRLDGLSLSKEARDAIAGCELSALHIFAGAMTAKDVEAICAEISEE